MLDDNVKASDFLEQWLSGGLVCHDDANQRTLNHYYRSYINCFPAYVKKSYERRLSCAVSLIKKHQGLRVLEIGSGCGTESLYFSLCGANVVGVELVEQYIRIANDRLDVVNRKYDVDVCCEFISKSILDFDADCLFDLIWMEEAFHHLEPRADVVKKISSLLAPGGQIIVAEPNALNPLIQAKLFKLRGFKTVISHANEDGTIHQWGNERVLSARSLTRLFANNGIKILGVDYFRFFPNMVGMNGFVMKCESVLEMVLPLFIKKFASVFYTYKGVKKNE